MCGPSFRRFSQIETLPTPRHFAGRYRLHRPAFAPRVRSPMVSSRIALRTLFALSSLLAATAASATRPYPILFVTQVPTPGDFTAVASVFGNHQPALGETPRGGDLYVLYPDGTLRNL